MRASVEKHVMAARKNLSDGEWWSKRTMNGLVRDPQTFLLQSIAHSLLALVLLDTEHGQRTAGADGARFAAE